MPIILSMDNLAETQLMNKCVFNLWMEHLLLLMMNLFSLRFSCLIILFLDHCFIHKTQGVLSLQTAILKSSVTTIRP